MDFQNIIPLEAMERLEAKYGIELHLKQTPYSKEFYCKRSKNNTWCFVGKTIEECEKNLEELYEGGLL
nr:MAG TPA: hypothetical protein [Bacteriophage sp.]